MASSDLERGRGNELLVAVCFDSCWDRILPWVRQVRLATPSEDREGKDVVVETMVGDIFVQVKSSSRYLQKHFSRYPDIPVLVVYPNMTEEGVRRAMFNLLKKERSRRDASYDPRSDRLPPRPAPPPPLGVMRSPLREALLKRGRA